MTSAAGVPPLLSSLQRRGNPELVKKDYLSAITTAINHHPRSQQKAIGPSEVGTPCARKIAYKLLGMPERAKAPNWRATIGTATHAWLETVFDADNIRCLDRGTIEGEERWLIETRLTVGFVPGLGFITGSCDLYDRVTACVLDHKVVGVDPLKKYKANGPSVQYRVQAHLYGQGWVNAGHPVDQVAIAFLPRSGELADAYLWSEPWNPVIAAEALQRLARIKKAVDDLGVDALAVVNTADNYCGHCDWYRYGSPNLTQGCPGDQASALTQTQPALTLGATSRKEPTTWPTQTRGTSAATAVTASRSTVPATR